MNKSAVQSPWVKARESRSRVESEKKAAVLRAAAVAFVEHGFHGATMDMIAEMLDVSKPTVYKYYKNKNQLLHDCLDQASARHLALAREAVALDDSAIEKLKHYLYGSVNYYLDEIGSVLNLNETTGLDPDAKLLWRDRRDEITGMMREIIRQGMDNGEIDAAKNPKVLLLSLFAGFNDIPNWFNPEGKYTAREVCDQYFEIYLKGFQP